MGIATCKVPTICAKCNEANVVPTYALWVRNAPPTSSQGAAATAAGLTGVTFELGGVLVGAVVGQPDLGESIGAAAGDLASAVIQHKKGPTSRPASHRRIAREQKQGSLMYQLTHVRQRQNVIVVEACFEDVEMPKGKKFGLIHKAFGHRDIKPYGVLVCSECFEQLMGYGPLSFVLPRMD